MTTVFEHHIPLGTTLAGRFTSGPLLGAPGGQGAVYRAWDTVLNRYVAVKVIHPGLYQLHREDFDREAVILANLRSPHIIELLDVIEVGTGGSTTRALVMEEASRSLQSLVGTNGPAAVEAIHHTARGLRDVHAARCLHNDVKPSNILLVGDRWKVGDFGIARALDDGTHAFSSWADGDYAAPERKRGEVRTAGDVWSLAITAHEVLTGSLPAFGSDTALSSALPPGWRDLLEEGLRADPRSRPDIDQVVAATGALLREARAAAAVQPPPPSTRPVTVSPPAHPPVEEGTRRVAPATATRRYPVVPRPAPAPAAARSQPRREPAASAPAPAALAPAPPRARGRRARRSVRRAERARRPLLVRLVGSLVRLVLTLVWMLVVAAAVVAGLTLVLQRTSDDLGERADDLVERARTYAESELDALVDDASSGLAPGTESPSG